VQRARDARPVIFPEHADPADDVVDIVLRHLLVAQEALVLSVARLGQPPQIHDDFEQILLVLGSVFE